MAAESEAKALARASRESAATLKAQLAQQRSRFQAQQAGRSQQEKMLLYIVSVPASFVCEACLRHDVLDGCCVAAVAAAFA